MIAFVVTVGIFLPALGELGRMGQDPASLPRQLTVCDRTWDRGPDVTRLDRARRSSPATTASPSSSRRRAPGPVPAGACGAGVADEGCATVIYVRKGQDEYVPYELVADQ